MRAVVVMVRPDDYQVELFEPNAPQPMTRYLTDSTLPEEFKWKLGLLMFGLDDDEVGYKMHKANQYMVKITDKTFQLIRGTPHDDAGGKGQSEGEESSK